MGAAGKSLVWQVDSSHYGETVTHHHSMRELAYAPE